MRIVNWTNQLAIHQSSLMRELADLGWEATIVASETVSIDRQALGWMVPDFGKADIVLNPNRKAVDRLLGTDPENTINVFGAALSFGWGRYALYRAARLRQRIGLMSEGCDPDGWKGPVRWAKHSAKRALFGSRVQFLLAMGELGVRWFLRCGYPSAKLLPFGYFVEAPSSEPTAGSANAGLRQGYQIVFVGQLIRRKRIDLVIDAIGSLASNSIELTIIGDGPERTRLQQLAAQLGIDQITWRGALSNLEARAAMENADLLVLPSRYDGWGAVVNEALMIGTPVICSDHCGAADLVQEGWRGAVVRRNDSEALGSAIRCRQQEGRLTEEQRSKIRAWSGNYITGRSAAGYLEAVMEHVYGKAPRPQPPWRSRNP